MGEKRTEIGLVATITQLSPGSIICSPVITIHRSAASSTPIPTPPPARALLVAICSHIVGIIR